MILCMIDAMEGRESATADIPGTFLKTDYDRGDIHINLEGAMATLLEDIDPEYYKDLTFTDKRGRKCMYSEAKKAIYGTLEASLLFWEKLSKSLEEMGYQRNEYDWCVINKIIDNKQCTILRSSTCQSIVHCFLSMILLMTHQSYSFL